MSDRVFDLSKFTSKRPPAEAAPVKVRKRITDPFIRVPLWWIERATELTRLPGTLVLMVLLYEAWRTQSAAFPLPTDRLERFGVGRNVVRKILLDLECGRMITVLRRTNKPPIITMLGHGF
jgi:hypothetical protein